MRHLKRQLACGFLVFLISLPSMTQAELVRNMHPLLGLISVPAMLDTKSGTTVQLSMLNTYLPRQSENEILLLDGETTRAERLAPSMPSGRL